jgi:hemoglobin
MSTKPDITDRADVIHLVNSFYEKVKADDLLAPVFAHLNWPAHLPVMYDFWNSLIFGDRTYNGNPFAKHKDLVIEGLHFDRWLLLFYATLDEHFAGPRAIEVKHRATSIAGVFKYKMGLTQA